MTQDKAALVELAERCEAADGPTTGLFWAAFDAVHREPKNPVPWWSFRQPPLSVQGYNWRWMRFSSYLRARAWEQAAMLLIGSATWGVTADPAHGAVAYVDGGNRAEAGTPALALCAAALRALANQEPSQ